MTNIAATAAPAETAAALPTRLAKGFVDRLVIIIPYLWLLFFFLVPFIIVFKISLSQTAISVPPYTPVLDFRDGISGFFAGFRELNFDNYAWLTQDALYFNAYVTSLIIAAISTILTLIVGYPIAYGMARAPKSVRPTLLMLVILPFWTSFLIRVYAWIGILQQQGLLNNLLLWLGIIDQPLEILHTDVAVYIGIVYSYLPFMILPLYANLEKMDLTLLEAASDLGCRPWKAFLAITLPLSMPGIIAGSMLVFIPAVGEFVIPELLGGPDSLMIGRVLWNEFFSNRDWPTASAVAIAILVLLIAPIMLFQYYQARQAEASA